jgi:hypothetical protein
MLVWVSNEGISQLYKDEPTWDPELGPEMPLTKRCHIRWVDGAFQRGGERCVLSPGNLTSFRDILAVPLNG